MQGFVFHCVEAIISCQTKSDLKHLEMCALHIHTYTHT